MKQRVSTRFLTIASLVSMSMLWILFVLPGTGSVAWNLVGTCIVLAAMGAATALTRSTALVPGVVAKPVRLAAPARSVL
jgi:hypothetical protein